MSCAPAMSWKSRAAMQRFEIPVFVVPGQPANTITLPLGYGRQRAGRIGNGVGVDVYPLRTSGAMWFAEATALRKTGATYPLATTQHHHLMEGRDHRPHRHARGIACRSRTTPAFMHAGHGSTPETSMYPARKYDGYKWGMVVNQSACIGCNACVVACQAENNIPIVGKDQVARGREMHWLRIDHYHEGPADDSDALSSADDVPALRVGAVRTGVPRRGDDAQQRRPQRNDVQPLRRHAVLLEQLPVQSAAIQLLRLQPPAAQESPTLQLAAESGCHGPQPRRDGEMHVLRAADQRRPHHRRERRPQNPRRRGRHRLPGRLPHGGNRVRQSQRCQQRRRAQRTTAC